MSNSTSNVIVDCQELQRDNGCDTYTAFRWSLHRDPNALMEMTTQVSSFSDSPLDASLFEIPAGYTPVQADANQMLLAPTPARRH